MLKDKVEQVGENLWLGGYELVQVDRSQKHLVAVSIDEDIWELTTFLIDNKDDLGEAVEFLERFNAGENEVLYDGRLFKAMWQPHIVE